MAASAHPRRSATRTSPPGPSTGCSHPRCYARDFNDCSRKISREHYISDSILQHMGGSADVSGFEWLGGRTVGLPASALTAKILCERHNAVLSPLDSEAGRLFEALREIDNTLGDAAPPAPSKQVTINGPDIQRWLLKCLLGVTRSGGLTTPSIRDGDRCISILFGRASWPPHWGLYLTPKIDAGEYSYNGIALMTQHHPDTDEIWSLIANIAGLRLVLALGRLEGEMVGFHPAGVEFTHADRPGVQTLAIAWPTKPGVPLLPYVRSAPYRGERIDHF